MKILVTGGTGYIGSHTAVKLLEEGYEVVIVDDLSNSELSVLDAIEEITGKRPEFHEFDLCDADKVTAFFQEQSDIEAIIHFAASKAVGESVQNPLKYYRNNLGFVDQPVGRDETASNSQYGIFLILYRLWSA